ncbi:uncharacterized protein B0I36DRAFT_316271 [Microdochium trichocladiopsis]|uniref:Uncharacterized protein n=1 Tax=Microdochium trichocladiopsis TaxID=1682393 RepID=A0A9P9BEL4_9PEZI|nr:uncharacterized protein B0I36DRAFT_343403 [Microdochium trichocladiopsis]XP_046017564.1 uncharacterized protein B0I36DRAFT_316271 [Microdochium trichocladiopsis]KAH7007831.1 hypothetical protein B0I36DRAFT_343403 [Microdochium trichocladiopsis]KAH7038443.1 hypothetical protein B0I36DRAFT_316271 [Microdochium trichocladiopsis]
MDFISVPRQRSLVFWVSFRAGEEEDYSSFSSRCQQVFGSTCTIYANRVVEQNGRIRFDALVVCAQRQRIRAVARHKQWKIPGAEGLCHLKWPERNERAVVFLQRWATAIRDGSRTFGSSKGLDTALRRSLRTRMDANKDKKGGHRMSPDRRRVAPKDWDDMIVMFQSDQVRAEIGEDVQQTDYEQQALTIPSVSEDPFSGLFLDDIPPGADGYSLGLAGCVQEPAPPSLPVSSTWFDVLSGPHQFDFSTELPFDCGDFDFQLELGCDVIF